MGECVYIFDVDGVLLEKKGSVGSEESVSRKTPGMLVLEDRARKGKIIVLSGRSTSERRKIVEELARRGLDPGLVERFIFRDEDSNPREWKLKAIEEIAEEREVCEVHEDDEEMLWKLLRNPLFRKAELFVYVDMLPRRFP